MVRSESGPSLVELYVNEDISPLQLNPVIRVKMAPGKASNFDGKYCEKLQLDGEQAGGGCGAHCLAVDTWHKRPPSPSCGKSGALWRSVRSGAEQIPPAAFPTLWRHPGFYSLQQNSP